MMTTTPVPSPMDARRPYRIKEAIEIGYHLAHQLKGYPSARNDGFGLSHLERVEKILAETHQKVTEMIRSERNANIGSSGETNPSPLQTQINEMIDNLQRTQASMGLRQTVVTGFDGTKPDTEPTVPPSLLDQISRWEPNS